MEIVLDDQHDFCRIYFQHFLVLLPYRFHPVIHSMFYDNAEWKRIAPVHNDHHETVSEMGKCSQISHFGGELCRSENWVNLPRDSSEFGNLGWLDQWNSVLILDDSPILFRFSQEFIIGLLLGLPYNERKFMK